MQGVNLCFAGGRLRYLLLPLSLFSLVCRSELGVPCLVPCLVTLGGLVPPIASITRLQYVVAGVVSNSLLFRLAASCCA